VWKYEQLALAHFLREGKKAWCSPSGGKKGLWGGGRARLTFFYVGKKRRRHPTCVLMFPGVKKDTREGKERRIFFFEKKRGRRGTPSVGLCTRGKGTKEEKQPAGRRKGEASALLAFRPGCRKVPGRWSSSRKRVTHESLKEVGWLSSRV